MWTFARKHDILTCEKITITMAACAFHSNKLLIIDIYMINRTLHGCSEIHVNTWREISYLHVAM